MRQVQMVPVVLTVLVQKVLTVLTKLPAGPPGVRITCVFSASGCFLATMA